ncbi:MAG: hypothetical protein AB3N14_00945 [Flavobacteriaceae bacterium]
MKLFKVFIALFISLSFVSCKEAKKAEEDMTQMKRVMAMHDEVMPKMGAMAKLAGELSSKEDSTALGLQYKGARRDLQEARDAMMDWMQGFGNKFDTDEIMNGKELNAQKQTWLNEEEEKMKALRDQINSSIANAEKLLEGE